MIHAMKKLATTSRKSFIVPNNVTWCGDINVISISKARDISPNEIKLR
jgi:hypothetical protein